MTNWEELRSRVGKAANKAAKKTEELADSAAKYVKIKSIESKINSLYEVLGKLTYKQLKEGTSQAEKISRVIEEIDSLRAQRKAIKAEIEAEKQRRAEEKAIKEELSLQDEDD